jgi:energy-coupling factor transport system substrate-specific component
MTWQLASFTILALVLVGGFAWYERSRPPSQIVALVAALAALAVAGRLALAPIPNVVATTDIVIFSGYALGGAPGFVVGALAGLISNFWLGQGPWTPWQMAGWGLAGIGGAGLAWVTRRRAGRLELTAACAFAGIAYGALLNFSLMVSYGGEFTFGRWLVLEGRAVPFDLAHAIGNAVLALAAGPAMVRMLIRFRQRFEYSWSSGASPPADDRRPGLAGAATLLVVSLLALMLAASASASSATGWLARVQNPDGGFAASPGDDSSPDMTGWAMLGLESAGVNPADVGKRGRSPLDYLRRNVAELRSPGDLARTILALEGAGVDARHFAGRDLAARLAGRRRGDGSYEGWPNSTAFALMALRASGVRASSSRSLSWLHKVQGDDGGWGAVPGAPSDPDSTGAVLQALGGGSGAARRGVRYLRRVQRGNGGWALAAGGPVNSQSTAWAVQGLIAAGIDAGGVRRHGRSGLDFLASRRGVDGHYRYSASSDQTPVWVTGQAMVASERKAFPLAAVAGASSAPAVAPASKNATGPGSADDRLSTLRGSASGVGEGRPLNPGRFGKEQGRPQRDADSGGSGESAADPESGGTSAPASGPSDDHGSQSDDSSPLVPVGIGLAAAIVVLGGGWFASRRLTAKS